MELWVDARIDTNSNPESQMLDMEQTENLVYTPPVARTD